jgi:hypothetical protein
VSNVNDARFFLENISVDPIGLEKTLHALELR